VLEVKGQDTLKDKTKRDYLDEWVRAVNEDYGFGRWRWAVSTNPADLTGVLSQIVE
jgi:type III restriction enzyme